MRDSSGQLLGSMCGRLGTAVYEEVRAPVLELIRSNLERSFESLQKQFQAKVDELERVKRELGHDDNKRRRTSNEIRHTSER